MTWFTLIANQTAAESEHVNIFRAVDIDLPSGHVRLWTGYGDLVIGGNAYTGAGKFARSSDPSERTGLDAARKTFGISGAELSPGMIAESDIDNSKGRSVKEYVGFLGSAGQLVAEPEISWEGSIDGIRRIDGAEPAIEINAEHRMIILDKSTGLRRTNEHQQQFFAGDTGYSQVNPSLVREISWGGLNYGGGTSQPGGGGLPPDGDRRGPGGGAR